METMRSVSKPAVNLGRRLGAAALALLLALSVPACTEKAASPAAETASSAGVQHLTQKQMLEDYDTMWKDIDENYSLMGVAERTTGKDFSKVRAQYRSEVAQDKTNEEFLKTLIKCTDEFEQCGHMLVFGKEEYEDCFSLYKNVLNPKGSYLYKTLNNPPSKKFYHYNPQEDADIHQKFEEAVSANSGKSGNVTSKILEEGKTAYLQIHSFSDSFIDIDAPQIARFFQKIQNYKYCILDIRGNGGGNTVYWCDNLVSSNLRKSCSYNTYQLVRGNKAKEYLKTAGYTLSPISEFPKLPNTNPDDLAQMQYFIRNTQSCQPQGKPVFKGKFYLLTDGRVYSSAEAFAIFCKDTGFATLVGETTGGDGVGCDPLIFALPNSGVCFRFSAALGLNPDGGSNEEFGTAPDIPCKADDALRVCLKTIESQK